MFNKYKRKKSSILFKFGIIFVVFVIVTLSVSGIFTYIYQEQIYRKRQEQKLHDLADYLSLLITVNGSDFADYQKHFLKNYDNIIISMDFTSSDVEKSKKKFESLFAQKYPSKAWDNDIKFDDLDDEVKNAYTVFRHEYYFTMFDSARKSFNLKYVYYIVPYEETLEVCYMLDVVPEPRIDNDKIIQLGITLPLEPSKHRFMWEAWDTGEIPSGYDIFDNEYGHTYAWYVPLYVNGKKLGLIGTEIDVENYNHAIIVNTVNQLVIIAVILIIAVVIVLFVINKFYISRLKHLAQDIFKYSFSKDAKLAGIIEKATSGHDEIAELGNQTASMIMELENYMKSLVSITNQLSETKEQVNAMSKLANKDALTGVKNRNAYEDQVKHLEWHIDDGKTEFAIVMADLNYLKRINDTYGHEHGNFALKKCCKMLCEVFGKSCVFRIGGDEFVIVLENEASKSADEKIKQFYDLIDSQKEDTNLEVWEKISVAVGYARFEPSQDEGVANVFKRADKAMYAKKVAMKANRK